MMLGGYRIVRKLGSGSHADVWLGSDGKVAAAIKVYRPDPETLEVDSRRIDSEIEALARVSHRHIVRLDDLATAPDGTPCLILQRVSTLSLGRLLASRSLTRGEAVTILAPMALAVHELHRSGVAHGAIRPSAVHFDDDGAPVLAHLGSAVVFGEMPADQEISSVPPATLNNQGSVASDIDDLVALCRAALGNGVEDGEWLDGLSLRDAHTVPHELSERLFELAAPAPVDLAMDGARDDGSFPPLRPPASREREAGADPAEAANDRATASRIQLLLALFHLPDSVSHSIARWGDGGSRDSFATAVVKRLIDLVRPVRRVVWLMAGAVVAAIIAFVALVPPQATKGPESGPEGNVSSASPRPSTIAADPDIAGEDPIPAARALLAARVECFELRSLGCLDGVDQMGSSALEADRYQIRLAQEGGIAEVDPEFLGSSAASPRDSVVITVVERLGDTVLLAVNRAEADSANVQESSLLLVRSDGAWRIRDLVASHSGQN
jgi:hypothetical protein